MATRFIVTIVLLGIWWLAMMAVAVFASPKKKDEIPGFQRNFALAHGIAATLTTGALGFWFRKPSIETEYHLWIFIALAIIAVSVPGTALVAMKKIGDTDIKGAAFGEGAKIFGMLIPNLALVAGFYFGAPEA